jgi:hypothetical protein
MATEAYWEKSSWLAHGGGLWLAHAPSAQPERAWHAVTARCATRARGVAQCSMARQRLIGDEVFTETFYRDPSTSRTIKNLEAGVRAGSSLAKRTGRQQPKASTVETATRSKKGLPAQSELHTSAADIRPCLVGNEK